LVRSPPAPKITSVQGGAGRLPAGPGVVEECGPASSFVLTVEASESDPFGVVDMGFT